MGSGVLDEFRRPLIYLSSVKLPYCAVCGKNRPLNDWRKMMSNVTTLPEVLWPLMHIPSDVAQAIESARCCVVCGRNYPLNRHHIVRRGAGELYEDGKRLPKPLITLCGMGNDRFGLDATGNRVEWCHGKAHALKLHFRNNGGAMEFLETDEPTDYLSALEMGGWTPLERRIYGCA